MTILSGLVVAGPASAGESALAQVPGKASIVFHVRGIDRCKDRLMTLARNSLPADAAQKFQAKLESALKQRLHGRQLKGLPADGPIFIVMTGLPKPGGFKEAIILRVANYVAFRDSILTGEERKTLKTDPGGFETATIQGQALFLVKRGDFAFLTPHKELAVEFTKKQPGLDAKLGPKHCKQFLDADVSVYLDAPDFFKTFIKEMKTGRNLLEKALVRAYQFHPGDKLTAGAVKKMIGLVFQAAQDSRAFLAFAEFRPDGLSVQAQAPIDPATKTGALLKKFKTSPLASLGRMPAGQMGYSALLVEPALLKMFPAWLYAIAADPDNPNHQVIRKAVKDLAAAGPRSMAVSYQKMAAVQMPLAGIQVWKYRHPERAVKARLRLVKALRAGEMFEGLVLKTKPVVKANAHTYQGVAFHYSRLTWDIERMLGTYMDKKIPEAQKKKVIEAFKKLLGEGRKAWFGTDGKVVIQVTAPDWKGARRQINRYLAGKGTLSEQPAFQETRKHLPARTTVLHLLEASAYSQGMGEFLKALAEAMPNGGKGKFPVFPAVKGKAAYIGAAFTLEPGSGGMDVWFPATAVNQFYQVFLGPIFKMSSKTP
jgi:hypothetical protein